ncbi:alpha/beta fold hydrolase [Tabrizicola sp.]|uniref:alpha/beta fold hydrolase n=1 Tax=Tabrizicola sp. TaxID=2005166 RepID=UPI002735D35E|nr:alpha/beta hydrolase [Tabrizicola sp.]MDP3196917.1 alpha/beta hydrolase [Tabrizicola sp.]
MLRILKGTTLAVAALSSAGAVYELLAEAGDAERYPVPGLSVDIDGLSLHITCLGQGSPTVIVDAGLGGTSRDWVLVQARLAAQTRVCAYDRAGMGHSDPGPEPRSPARISDELRRLLKSAGVPGPYVLLAHSLSGKSARLFAAAHPEDVAGMVLVDTRSEKIDSAKPPEETEAFAAALKRQAMLLTLARKLGLVRLLGSILTDEPRLPPGVATEMALLQTQPQSLRATIAEGLARSLDDAALNGASLGAIPLVVIAAGDSMASIPGWAEAQAELAALSREGRLVVAEGSSHLVQIDQPEIVIDAVLSVLDVARKGE